MLHSLVFKEHIVVFSFAPLISDKVYTSINQNQSQHLFYYFYLKQNHFYGREIEQAGNAKKTRNKGGNRINRQMEMKCLSKKINHKQNNSTHHGV